MTTPRLLTLTEAADSLGSNVKARSLKTEIDRGRLKAIKIGGRLYVTETDLLEMINACREQGSRPACTREAIDGSSSTDQLNTAQASALTIAEELKQRSRHTSPESTSL